MNLKQEGEIVFTVVKAEQDVTLTIIGLKSFTNYSRAKSYMKRRASTNDLPWIKFLIVESTKDKEFV